MQIIKEKTRYKIFNVPPKDIRYCIFPSKYCDYTQFNSSKHHPHAGQDRGVFKENLSGYIKIKEKNWDGYPGILFSKLLEYQALFNHYKGKENWKKSEFASRCFDYMNKTKIKDRGFKNANEFLSGREKQINSLFESIIKNGIYPVSIKKNKKLFVDNISIALTRDMKFYFNNRGHHRLSIAKILGLKFVPVKITVAKNTNVLKKFLFTDDKLRF